MHNKISFRYVNFQDPTELYGLSTKTGKEPKLNIQAGIKVFMSESNKKCKQVNKLHMLIIQEFIL